MHANAKRRLPGASETGGQAGRDRQPIPPLGDEARRADILEGLRLGLAHGVEEELPATLAECHALIRELREALQPVEAEKAQLVAAHLKLSVQQAALVLILARAKGRPLTSAQLELRIPNVFSEVRHASFVRTVVHAARQRLGTWSILVMYPYGYALDLELAELVRRLAP